MNVQGVNETKNRILSIIKTQGPSYPAKLAREMNLAPLFVSAFMSELVNEQKLKMSSMKVGGSPVYISPGQEPLLENFIGYLGSKEREAVSALRNNQILEDQEQDPAIRVALQSAKDFAIPFALSKEGQSIKYWRYFTISENDAKLKLAPAPKKQPEVVSRLEPVLQQPIQVKEEVKKSTKKREVKDSVYLRKVQEHFSQKNASLEDIQYPKAKEYHAKLALQTPLGTQRYLAIVKEKKKLTEEDIALALHKAQTEKMPALMISPGSLDKGALELLQAWKDLIRIEKIS